MTPDQIALVQRSFAELEASEPGFSHCFYTRLFQLDTSLRVLFQGDSAAQGARLMQMLKLAVGALARTEALAPTLRSLGARTRATVFAATTSRRSRRPSATACANASASVSTRRWKTPGPRPMR